MATTRSSQSSDTLRDDLVHEIHELVVDGSSPFSVLFPELNLTFPERALTARDVLTLIVGMQARGLVQCVGRDPRGAKVPVDESLIETIAAAYDTGARDAAIVRQIDDDVDIWVTVPGRDV